MPAIANKSSLTTGQCGHPPSTPAAWSPNVYTNSLNVERQGDEWKVHPDGFHPGRRVAAGSATVFANSKQLARIGDPLTCGDSIATGSPNCFAGG